MAKTADSGAVALRNTDAPTISGIDSVRDAFKRYQTAQAALLLASDPGELNTAEEMRCWNEIDLADKAVCELPATCHQDIALKLYLSIWHSTCDAEIEKAAIRADLAWFERHDAGLDWQVRQIVSALRSLKLMEG